MPGPVPPAESWESLVNRWRSRSRLVEEDFDRCWERIRIACAGLNPPIIILALDGIDEVGDTSSEKRNVGELIAHFRLLAEELKPDSRLIVTCRIKKTLDAYLHYDSVSGVDLPGLKEFKVDDFDSQEFRMLWQIWFSGEELPPLAEEILSPKTVSSSNSPPGNLVDRIQSLKHPALFGMLRRLDSAEERQAIFSDNAQVWAKLMKFYISWFSLKVSKRRKGYSTDRVEAVLKSVARACESLISAVDTYSLEEHWVKPAMSEFQFGREIIEVVFDEAVSCGLVDSDGRANGTYHPVPWNWRFRFLQSHLSKLA